MPDTLPLYPAVPTGTKVLIRCDQRVGFVVAFDYPIYRVRFADGDESNYERTEFSIFKQADAEIPGGLPSPETLRRFVIFRSVTGSTAYGLNHADSDIDRRGFYLPPADLHWSLAGVPEQLETDNEECYWELGKFIRLALKANPTVLECLFSPLVETCTPLADELVAIRDIFLSQHIHRTHNSYVLSQFKKLEQDLRARQGIKWKHAMHLIRLLLAGIAALKEGSIQLRMDKHRDVLLAIRRGEVPWKDVDEWRLALHRELDEALRTTSLPPGPDYDRANTFLLRARQCAASKDYF